MESDVVGHICNPSTWETKAEGLQVQGQPGLHHETLYQQQNNFIEKMFQLEEL
jgi:hypothetical protein